MKKNILNFLIISIIGSILVCNNSCSKKVGPTTVVIEDSCRHYYPILQGQYLDVAYKLTNTGKEPLVLTDINPSCGCVSVESEHNNIILPEKSMILKFRFDSSKYVGYAKEKVYIFGNINPTGMIVLVFDVNVVPNYDASPDYEEYYYENEKTKNMIEGIINGKESERGYWINNGDNDDDYSMNHEDYLW